MDQLYQELREVHGLSDEEIRELMGKVNDIRLKRSSDRGVRTDESNGK